MKTCLGETSEVAGVAAGVPACRGESADPAGTEACRYPSTGRVRQLPMLWMAAVAIAAAIATSEMPAQVEGSAEEQTFDDRFPAWSPDGARIAFVSDRDEPGIFQLYVASSDGSGLTALTSGVGGADWPVWTPDGEWIYYDSRIGENFEIFRIHSSGGEPVRVTESEEGTDSHVSLSAKGGVAFDSNREADGLPKIYTMAPDGSKLRLITVNPHSNLFPAWSPDGEWIAFRIRKSTFSPISEIHVIKPDGSGLRAVTKLGAAATHPAWSPDGTRIVFVAVIDGNHEICVTSADGLTVERLTETARNELRPTFSHDGTEILFCANESGRFGVYKMKAEGSEPQLIGFVTDHRAAEAPTSP